jgi:hypothetical protein
MGHLKCKGNFPNLRKNVDMNPIGEDSTQSTTAIYYPGDPRATVGCSFFVSWTSKISNLVNQNKTCHHNQMIFVISDRAMVVVTGWLLYQIYWFCHILLHSYKDIKQGVPLPMLVKVIKTVIYDFFLSNVQQCRWLWSNFCGFKWKNFSKCYILK